MSLPGTNVLESKTGRAPAFSFGARHNGKLDSAGPGPGQYNVTGLSAKGIGNTVGQELQPEIFLVCKIQLLLIRELLRHCVEVVAIFVLKKKTSLTRQKIQSIIAFIL